MEYHLKDLLNKVLLRQTRKCMEIRKADWLENIESIAESTELRAKFNMLDARLAAENIDTLIRRDIVNENVMGDANALKDLANEQAQFNYNFIDKCGKLSDAEIIALFGKNVYFKLVDEIIKENESTQWLDYDRASYGVSPDTLESPGINPHMSAIVAKFQTRLKGLPDDDTRLGVLESYLGDSSAALEFDALLKNGIGTNKENRDPAYLRAERKMFAHIIEIAERNFEEFGK